MARAVKEDGPTNVNYASVNGSITSESPVVAGQKNAFGLRLTDSVVQPLSGCDLLDDLVVVELKMHLQALLSAFSLRLTGSVVHLYDFG